MQRIVTIMLLAGCVGICLASGGEKVAVGGDAHDPVLTPEYLRSHGFKTFPKDRRTFVAETIRLGDAVRRIGVPLARVYPLEPKLLDSEARKSGVWAIIPIEGCAIYVYGEERNRGSRTIAAALKDPKFVCRVVVVVDPAIPAAQPRLRIRSVEITNRVKRNLRVVFELSAVGRTPLAVSQSQFGVQLTGATIKHLLVGTTVVFPNGTPNVVTTLNTKSILLTMDVSAIFEELDEPVDLATLPPGDYRLGVILFGDPRAALEFDYQFRGRFESEERVIQFKPVK